MSRFRSPINTDPHPDVYLPNKRARRVVRPHYLSRWEIPKWRDGTLGQAPKLKFVPPGSLPPVPPVEPPVPASAEERRRRPAPRYLVTWRDEWGECGQEPRAILASADGFARAYQRPQCWAAVIDRKTCRVLTEYGIRFAELVAERLAASQGVSLRRKEPGRVAAEQMARRATA